MERPRKVLDPCLTLPAWPSHRKCGGATVHTHGYTYANGTFTEDA